MIDQPTIFHCDHCLELKEVQTYYYETAPTPEARNLCDDCAKQLGFCPGCGTLCVGSDWDVISLAQHGICNECWEELRIEMGECTDEEYYDD